MLNVLDLFLHSTKINSAPTNRQDLCLMLGRQWWVKWTWSLTFALTALWGNQNETKLAVLGCGTREMSGLRRGSEGESSEEMRVGLWPWDSLGRRMEGWGALFSAENSMCGAEGKTAEWASIDRVNVHTAKAFCHFYGPSQKPLQAPPWLSGLHGVQSKTKNFCLISWAIMREWPLASLFMHPARSLLL